MTEQWENEIIQLLQTNIQNCGVKAYPETPKNYKPKHSVGEILVRYDYSKYSQTDISQSYQEREVNMELVLYYRRLRGKTGLYPVMENVKQILYGKRLTNTTSGIQFEREDLIGEDNGIWAFGMRFKFNAIFSGATPSRTATPSGGLDINIDSGECRG